MATLSALNGNGAVVASIAEIAGNWTPGADGERPANVMRPEVFYDTQLLDTIRDAAETYQYYRYAKPIDLHGADKITMRRWAPLQAHTTPLEEGVPPMTDKGSVEVYEISAGNQYGRYMEFTDKVNFEMVDPVLTHYTSEYAIVAIETLDLLARDTLLTCAQKYFANGAANLASLVVAGDSAIPALADFRLIALALKKAKVEPYDSTFHAMVSSEFIFDMMDDPYVQNYMRINNNAGIIYDSQSDVKLPEMFGFSFHEVNNCPTSSAWFDAASDTWKCIVTDGTDFYVAECDTEGSSIKRTSGYVKDRRTGKDASYIPNQITFADALAGTKAKLRKIAADGTVASAAPSAEVTGLKIYKVNHILILGKDCLVTSSISGEGSAKMYIKPLGSAGVLDPIEQRQSIGFKINDIGFGSTRLEAIVDYICVPTQLNV